MGKPIYIKRNKDGHFNLAKILKRDVGSVSDGIHTFDELYEHRIELFIALCKQLSLHKKVWRSKVHYDGVVWDGWFIVGIYTLPGEQISYHLPLSRWKDTEFIETVPVAPDWDGHTSNDVLNRLKLL